MIRSIWPAGGRPHLCCAPQKPSINYDKRFAKTLVDLPMNPPSRNSASVRKLTFIAQVHYRCSPVRAHSTYLNSTKCKKIVAIKLPIYRCSRYLISTYSFQAYSFFFSFHRIRRWRWLDESDRRSIHYIYDHPVAGFAITFGPVHTLYSFIDY